MRRCALLLPLLVSAACGGDSTLGPGFAGEHSVQATIDVALDRSIYGAGDQVAVTLVNNTSRDYGYNLCGRSYERRNGNDWSAMPPELRLCTADLRALPAGALRTEITDLPADFAPATYRMLVYLVETTPGGNTSAIAFSAPFTVQ
jgi:hypothetical protein